jgi:hypothetical protein
MPQWQTLNRASGTWIANRTDPQRHPPLRTLPAVLSHPPRSAAAPSVNQNAANAAAQERNGHDFDALVYRRSAASGPDLENGKYNNRFHLRKKYLNSRNIIIIKPPFSPLITLQNSARL